MWNLVLEAIAQSALTPAGWGRLPSGDLVDAKAHARRLRRRFDRGRQVVLPAFLAPNTNSFAQRGHLRVRRGDKAAAWHPERAPRNEWQPLQVLGPLGNSVIRHDVAGIRFNAQGWTALVAADDAVVLLDGPYGQRFEGLLAPVHPG